jgi:hypothetical protein
MSDVEFDRLLAELAQLEKDHPDLDDLNSPTHRVGGQPLTGFKAFQHAVPMLSIDNTYDQAALKEWHQRILRGLAEGKSGSSLFDAEASSSIPALRFVCDPKIDGVAAKIDAEPASSGPSVADELPVLPHHRIKCCPLCEWFGRNVVAISQSVCERVAAVCRY